MRVTTNSTAKRLAIGVINKHLKLSRKIVEAAFREAEKVVDLSGDPILTLRLPHGEDELRFCIGLSYTTIPKLPQLFDYNKLQTTQLYADYADKYAESRHLPIVFEFGKEAWVFLAEDPGCEVELSTCIRIKRPDITISIAPLLVYLQSGDQGCVPYEE